MVYDIVFSFDNGIIVLARKYKILLQTDKVLFILYHIMTNAYEFTIIVRNAAALVIAQKLLESFGGKKIDEKAWGKRILTYPIKKETSAEYYTWNIQLDKAKLAMFNTKLNYEDAILRHLILLK